MYNKINSNIDDILMNLNPLHVSDYDWLKSNLYLCDVSKNLNYQKKYRNYWVMRFTSPDSKFNKSYFECLEKYKNNTDIKFLDICRDLSQLTIDEKHTKYSFQFSFITKLVHMIDNKFPIYDSMVGKFYNLPKLTSKDVSAKIFNANKIVNTLKKEQETILLEGSLDNSIEKFLDEYPSSLFSKEKILDTLIWAYISKTNKSKRCA